MDELADQIRAMAEAGDAQYRAPMQSAGGGGGSGFFGALQTLGTGYLSRRIDIDLQSRVMQPGTAQLRGGNTAAINQTVSGNMLAGVSNNTMLVLGVVAVAALVLIVKS